LDDRIVIGKGAIRGKLSSEQLATLASEHPAANS
jgi:hypothetical protein